MPPPHVNPAMRTPTAKKVLCGCLVGVALAAISYRTGRLGMNMVSHASFNLVAILAILSQRGGVH